jgi:Predicted mannose-6-phosphate isomerase
MCLRGWAATLVGPDMTPHLHGPGEFAYIPPGVLHVGVNLSRRSSLLALEVRTDPTFHDDMVVVDDYEQAARAAVAALQDRAAAGELGLPSDWEDSDSTVRWQQWVNDGATAQW